MDRFRAKLNSEDRGKASRNCWMTQAAVGWKVALK